MAEVLIEEDFAHMGAVDMKWMLALLDGLDLEAEPTSPRDRDPGEVWTMHLHWLQEGPVSADTEAALRGSWLEIQGHFAAGAKPSPSCLEVNAPDGGVLLRLKAVAT